MAFGEPAESQSIPAHKLGQFCSLPLLTAGLAYKKGKALPPPVWRRLTLFSALGVTDWPLSGTSAPLRYAAADRKTPGRPEQWLSDVVVEMELVRVRAQPDGID